MIHSRKILSDKSVANSEPRREQAFVKVLGVFKVVKDFAAL